MSTLQESWKRLESEAWCSDKLLASRNDRSAKFMLLSQGAGPYKRDEYSITVDSFPSGLSPLMYLKEFAMSPNDAVSSTIFNVANRFKKRVPGRLALGDIWDIDILGPDNGSIVLVKTSGNLVGAENVSVDTDGWFDIHTIECEKYGTHPECGAREFGFERLGGGVKIYTRGVSRAYMHAHRTGTPIQDRSWKSMLSGIADVLIKHGASIQNSDVSVARG